MFYIRFWVCSFIGDIGIKGFVFDKIIVKFLIRYILLSIWVKC